MGLNTQEKIENSERDNQNSYLEGYTIQWPKEKDEWISSEYVNVNGMSNA